MTELPNSTYADYNVGPLYTADQMRDYAAAVSAADNAALRADAERYRFLRDVAWHEGALLPFLERYGPFEWDDAIDEARGEI